MINKQEGENTDSKRNLALRIYKPQKVTKARDLNKISLNINYISPKLL